MLGIRLGYRHDDGTRGLRQTEAADLAGLTQPKISRAEQAKSTFEPEEAEAYATALRASPAQVSELVALCRDSKAGTYQGQARLVRSGAEIQRRISRLEEQSALMRSWQPTMIPALLQTWDYTVALIERDPDEKWAAARRARLALLDEPDKRFEVVLSEGALRWRIGSRATMTGQLRHLAELAARPNVDVGIVPFGQSIVPPPEGAFHLYGDRTAVVATDAGTTFLTEREDLDGFAAMFRRLADVAVYGADAHALIGRAEDAD